MYQFAVITPAQARAARAIMGLPLKGASEQIGVGINTLGKFEQDDRGAISLDTAYKVAQFYQRHGLDFPDDLTIRQRAAQIEQAA